MLVTVCTGEDSGLGVAFVRRKAVELRKLRDGRDGQGWSGRCVRRQLERRRARMRMRRSIVSWGKPPGASSSGGGRRGCGGCYWKTVFVWVVGPGSLLRLAVGAVQ